MALCPVLIVFRHARIEFSKYWALLVCSIPAARPCFVSRTTESSARKKQRRERTGVMFYNSCRIWALYCSAVTLGLGEEKSEH